MVSRLFLAIAAPALLAGCATTLPPPAPGYERVTLAELHRRPEYWDGRKIEVRGFVVREFESSNIYPTYGAYCGGGFHSAVGVRWPRGLSDPIPHNRSNVLLRGTFENTLFGPSPDSPEGTGPVLGGYWFGPIHHVEIAAVLSDPRPTCSPFESDQERGEP